jgi:hypothetical protein
VSGIQVQAAVDDIGITADNGAVKGVEHLLALILFIHDQGVEDAVHPAPDQVQDMGVGQLGRKADIVGHDTAFGGVAHGHGGSARQHDIDAAMNEKRVPEGKILIKIQTPGNPHGEYRVLVRCQVPVKQQPVLEIGKIKPFFSPAPAFGPEYFFTPVA